MIKKEVFEEYMKEYNLSKNEFCKICKIDCRTYDKIVSNKAFNLLSIFKIARATNIEIKDMFVE